MPAFYKIKDNGTATLDAGRVTVQPTGSFAADGVANYYPSMTAARAATTPPIAGDFFIVSDLHNLSAAAALTYSGLLPNPYFVVVVDDANMDAARTTGNRGREDVGGGSGTDMTIVNQFISGMELETNDNIVFSGKNELLDCKLICPGAGDNIVLSSDGSFLRLGVPDLNLNSTTSAISVSGGSELVIDGGIVTTVTVVDNLLNGGFITGGGTVTIKGLDASVVTGTILNNVGGDAVNDDIINVRLDSCDFAAGVAHTSETFKGRNHRYLATRCSDSSAAAEYQYHLHAFGGDVDDDSAIFRNEDEPFTESNQKISYKIVTNSDASLGSPLWFDFPILRYSKLSVGATDTLRFYLTSNTALTNKDIYIEISYPDGTNKQTPNFLTSAPATVGGTLDLMATGTTLATDGSSSWTGALSNLYQIDVDTSGDVGADCQPIVKFYVTIPSVTIQMASEYGLS